MMLQRAAQLALGLLILIPTISLGQFGISVPTQGLSATGTEKIRLKPEKVRLIMLIKAQGADAKAAVLALSEHKDRVQKELESMKAEKDSVAFSPTQVSTGDGDENNAARMMQIQMMRNAAAGGGSTQRKTMPTIYTATCAVKAEWPLPVKEGDALAVLPATLRDQITLRDLAGEKNKPKLSKADQEQWEEMQAMMQENYSYSSGDDATRPRILFVAQVPDDVRQQATQTAFKKAVKEVQLLSTSAGITLGKLVGLTSMAPNNIAERMYAVSSYNNTSSAQMTEFQPQEGSVGADNADNLALEVAVTVTFDIK